MKIVSLEVYGFGRLSNQTFELNQSFTQIFGENEAGKSTLQHFIHLMLFGFDQIDHRLEPRYANQFGGKMMMQFEDETVEIERIYLNQKEIHNVTMNGMKKDLEWFNQKINFITNDTYKNIFSFNVLDLQEVHQQLTESHLQNYLLQAGIFGSNEFNHMNEHIKEMQEDYLTKEDSQIIKSIETIESLESRIHDKMKQFKTYDGLIKNKKAAQKKVDEYKQHIHQLTDLQKRKQKELAFHEDMKLWKQLELKLNITAPKFPEHGIDRYEAQKHQNLNLERDHQLRQERLSQLQKEKDQIQLVPQALITEVEQLTKEEQHYNETKAEVARLERLIHQLKSEQEGLMNNLGWSNIHDVEVGELIESQIHQETRNYEKAQLNLNQIERQKAFIDTTLKQKQKDLDTLNKGIVHDDRFEKGVQLASDKRHLEEKTTLYKSIDDASRSYEDKQLKKYGQLRLLFVMLSLVFLGASIYSFLNQQMIFGALFAVLLCFSIILFVFNKKPELHFNKALHDEIETLTESVNQLSKHYDLSFDVNEQRDLRQQKALLEDAIQREKNNLSHHVHEAELTTNALNQAKEQLQFLQQKLHIQNQFDITHLGVAVKLIHSIHQNKKELQALMQQLEEKNTEIERIHTIKNGINQQLNVDINESSMFHDLKQILVQNEKMQFRLEKNEEQLALVQKEIEIIERSLNKVAEEMHALFQMANAQDESHYYQQFEKYSEYQNHLAAFQNVSKKLESENFAYETLSELAYVTTEDLRNQESQVQDHLYELQSLLNEQTQHIQEIQNEMTIIERDGTLPLLRQKLNIETAKLNKLVKDLSSVNYIEVLINAHIKMVRDKRMPEVIDAATDYFKDLTNQKYTQIKYINHQLVVKQSDGQLFHPTDLSQSTKELLYIAFRLSLIKSLNKYYPFPILIDDAFVHFDKERRERIIEKLMKIDSNQVLYFTCNRSTVVNQKQTITIMHQSKEAKS